MSNNGEYRAIPREMWDELATQDAKTSEIIGTSLAIQRIAVIRIGKKYGFTEEQLQQSGLVAPPPPPRVQRSTDRKGGRSVR